MSDLPAQRVRRDSLPARFRNGGTSHLECFHQKLDTPAGPWAFGVCIGHCTMLLRSTRFSINAGVTRNGEPSFRHPHLHFGDRFQHQVCETWGVVILPRHQNGLDFKPTNFISVGMGPKHLDPLCVRRGPPSPGASPDIDFMARRVCLERPPLPFSTKGEFKKLNQQACDDPNVNSKWLKEKASKCRDLADGKTMLPKAASALKQRYEQSWKGGQLIKAAQLGMGKSLKELSTKLSCASTKSPPSVNVRNASAAQSSDEKLEAVALAPPVVAPHQMAEAPTRLQQEQQCTWSPLCGCRAEQCGGWTKSGCHVFGKNGAKESPMLQALDDAQKLVKKDVTKPVESKKKKSCENDNEACNGGRDCAWFPHCALPVSACGGHKRDLCCALGGDNPVFPRPGMNSEFAQEACRLKRVAQTALYHEKKRASKRASSAADSPLLLESAAIAGPTPAQGAAALTFRDAQSMLTFGSMMNDNVAQGHSNLLAQQLRELGLRARIVAPQLCPVLHERGWERVQRWV